MKKRRNVCENGSGGTCDSPALKGIHWCYYHSRLHQRQTVRHSHRRADGRFAAQPGPQNQSETLDYGSIPVAISAEPHPAQASAVPLELPSLEDAVSVQFALTDIMQALAANQLDGKRAGLLLYGLQVAAANIKNIRIPIDAVRSVTHTEDGAPLAPQGYGMDNEDYENCDEECEGCAVCGEYKDDEDDVSS